MEASTGRRVTRSMGERALELSSAEEARASRAYKRSKRAVCMPCAPESTPHTSKKTKQYDNSRFLRAQGRGFVGLTREEEGTWKDDFSFIQLADSQLGMLRWDDSWEEETEMLQLAVQHINRLQPRFVIMCGDLINAYPDNPKMQRAQSNDYKRLMSQIDSKISLVCLCGNHDIGNSPSRATIDIYRGRFGDDYFSFWVGGVRFLVLNTQVYKDASNCPDILEEQDRWLTEQVAETKRCKPVHTMAFSHVPPFIFSPEEEEGYFNLAPAVRQPLVRKMKRGGVCKWFCGHYHENSCCWDEDLEMIVTSAVGTVITRTGQDRLGLSSFKSTEIGADKSGFRIVRVTRESVTHEWTTLDSVPER